MAVLAELRYPTTTVAKVTSSILALVLLVFVSLATISGVLLYQILHPPRSTGNFDLGVMMGHPSEVDFTLDDGQKREGWFFPGLRGAPTVILCHGYQSQRSAILTLGASLQDQQYNVFLFDFTGHGANAGVTTLGYREVGELRAVLQTLANRDDVDPTRFGAWGDDIGAYSALVLASMDKRIAALAVDSAYNDPTDLVRLEVNQSGLAVFPLVSRFSQYGFKLLNYPYRQSLPVSVRLNRLAGVPKLFIETDSRPMLSQETGEFYLDAPGPKDQWRARLNYTEMTEDDRKEYENLIVSFFVRNLPLTAPAKATTPETASN